MSNIFFVYIDKIVIPKVNFRYDYFRIPLSKIKILFEVFHMTYSIGEISKMFQLPIHTLRYYDSEGLFPFVKRDEHDNRYFEEKDLKLIRSICCLKDTNMPLKEIKNYINLYMEGKKTLEKRYEIFYSHKEKLLKQIHDLEESMMVMDKTMNNYAKAIDEYKQSDECKQSSNCKQSGDYKQSPDCWKIEPDKSSYHPINERVNTNLMTAIIPENVEISK